MRLASFSLQEGSRTTAAQQAIANAPVSLSNPSLLATQIIQGVDRTKQFDLSKIERGSPTVDPSGIPAHLFDRYKEQFKGMPGLLLRLWNLICIDARNFDYSNDVMQRLYIPLITNLRFFEGVVAHPIVEEFLENNRATISREELDQTGSAGATVGSNPGTALSPLKASFPGLDSFSATIQIRALSKLLEVDPTVIGMMGLIKALYAEFFYEVITLASPVQRFDTGRQAELESVKDVYDKLEILEGDTIAPAETIVKPVMPIYFSPKCNVVYPKMYSSINVNDMYAEAPSRVEVNLSQLEGNVFLPRTLTFRSPPALRDAFLKRAIKDGAQEKAIDTYDLMGNTVAINEIARGVSSKFIDAPSWMSQITTDTIDGFKKVESFKELLTQYADYEYSISITSTRTGAVDMVFNPYIIPGYPMDIIDPGIYRPSYHAFCTSVTHSISASGSVTTSAGFTNAISYDELYGVDTPMALPWLSDALGMNSTLDTSLDTGDIKYSKLTSLLDADSPIIEAANLYYFKVLGVGAAFPDALTQYKYFDSEAIVPKILQPDVQEILQGTISPEQSLYLARRSIQTKANLEAVHAFKFIDTETEVFAPVGPLRSDIAFTPSTAPAAGTVAGKVEQVSFSSTKNGKLASGFNAFLDYSLFTIQEATVSTPSQKPASTSGSNQAPAASTGSNSTKVGSYSRFPVRTNHITPFEQVFRPAYSKVADTVDEMEALLRNTFNDYPQNLLKQILFAESSYIPTATSSVAFGLGQLTYRYFLRRFPLAFKSTTLGFQENVRVAYKELARLKRSYPTFTWNDVAVAYNQGQDPVRKAKAIGNGNADYANCRRDSLGGGGGLSYYNKVFDSSAKEQGTA